jgi:lipopolysaccharide export system protein LptC
MNARGSLWLPLVILLLLAGLSFWIEQTVRLAGSEAPAGHSDPEGIMENFNALRTDALGNPQYRLSASRLKHYSGSKRTEMEAPRFVQLNAASGDTVTTTARTAEVSADGNEIELSGGVSVQRAARPGHSALTLQTARLLAFPERDLLRAPGAVRLRDSQLDLRAGAMEYDIKRRVITLTGRVNARYISGKT